MNSKVNTFLEGNMTFVLDNHVSNNYLLTKRSLIVIMAEQNFARLLGNEAK